MVSPKTNFKRSATISSAAVGALHLCSSARSRVSTFLCVVVSALARQQPRAVEGAGLAAAFACTVRARAAAQSNTRRRHAPSHPTPPSAPACSSARVLFGWLDRMASTGHPRQPLRHKDKAQPITKQMRSKFEALDLETLLSEFRAVAQQKVRTAPRRAQAEILPLGRRRRGGRGGGGHRVCAAGQ